MKFSYSVFSMLTLSGCMAAHREPSSAGVSASGQQHETFLRWVDHKEEVIAAHRGENWTQLHFVPTPVNLEDSALSTPAVATRNKATTDLYFALFGRNTLKSFLWTGIETGNNRTMDLSYRWDSLEDAGMYNHENRLKLVDTLKKNGIWNLRLGMPNHLIHRLPSGQWEEKGWNLVNEVLTDFAFPCGETNTKGEECEGLRISLDMHHFGMEDRFRAADPQNSFYLNDAWPAYFGDFAGEAFRRFHAKIKAVTLINEPDTTTQFNAGFWHGAFPGWNQDTNQYTIERAINIAKAAVLARSAIERELKKHGGWQRPLFLHPEAIQSKPDDPEFVQFTRFLTSDLILGHPWLLSPHVAELMRSSAVRASDGVDLRPLLTDQAAKTSLGWVLQNAVNSSRKISTDGNPFTPSLKYDRVVKRLNEIRDLHLALLRETGFTMMSFTVFGADYYAPNESFASEATANAAEGAARASGKRGGIYVRAAHGKIKAIEKKTERMRNEPQFYAEDIRRGLRRGLFPVAADYYKRYGLPMMVGETGTAYFQYIDLWYQQMLLDAGALARSGVPFLGLTMYPCVDNWGWDEGKAMSRPKSESKKPLSSGVVWLHTAQMEADDKLPGARDYEAKPGLRAFVNELRTVFP